MPSIDETSSQSERWRSDHSQNGAATKNQKKNNVYQDNYFAVSVKLKTHCVDDQDKVQFGTDTNNEFTEYKHQRKSSNQLAFHLSAYMHLRKLLRTIFQKHTKYKLTV